VNAHASIRDLIFVVEPHLDVVAVSDPEPVLRAYNAVGVFPSRDEARHAVLAVENLDPHDTAVGMAVLGSSAQSEAVVASSTDAAGNPRGADREGVVRDIAPRAAKGAVTFGVVGAAIASVMIALFGDPELLVVGALTTAVFCAAVGAIWAIGDDHERRSQVPRCQVMPSLNGAGAGITVS
jgi:hypothetical protein